MTDSRPRANFERITGTRRGLTAFVGLTGLVFGTVAVFDTDNQAGTVALLTVGGLSSVLALLGRIPLRWVVGGADLDMTEEEIRETADALAGTLTPDQLDALLARLVGEISGTNVSTSNLRLAASISRAVAVENEGHSRMERLASLNPGWDYRKTDAPAGDTRADGVMKTPDGTEIAVIFKAWGGRMAASNRSNISRVFFNMVPKILAETGCAGVLIFTDLTTPMRELGEVPDTKSRKIRFVNVSDDDDFILGKFLELLKMAGNDD